MPAVKTPLALGEAFRLDAALQAIGAVCQIHTRVKHQFATLALHADVLVWVQSGTKTVRHAKGRHRCTAGSLLLLASGTVWDVVNDPLPQRSYQACAIQLAPEMVAEFHARYPALAGAARTPLATVLPVDGGLASSLQAAADALAGGGGLSPLLRRHRVTEVLLLLAERGWVFQRVDGLTTSERVRRVVAGRLHEDWRAPAVAQALHLSTSALGRQLAREGGTIAGIVRELRLETALGLLQSTQWPVASGRSGPALRLCVAQPFWCCLQGAFWIYALAVARNGIAHARSRLRRRRVWRHSISLSIQGVFMNHHFSFRAAAVLIAASSLLACQMPGAAQAEDFVLTSPQFAAGASLPAEHVLQGFGCTGGNHSPALNWRGVPAGTQSLALTVYDPDAPTGSGWWHWVVYNLPADTRGLPANTAGAGASPLPNGAVQGRTDFGENTYGGACPPAGDKPHRYVFTLHALKTPRIELPPDASAAHVGFMLHMNGLAQTRLVATYGR